MTIGRPRGDDVTGLHCVLQILACDAPKFRIVAGDIKVLNGRIGQGAINHGDEDALFLDGADRIGQLVGIVRQGHEGIDTLRGQVFQRIGLRGAVRPARW